VQLPTSHAFNSWLEISNKGFASGESLVALRCALSFGRNNLAD